jgi:hypothetical protein
MNLFLKFGRSPTDDLITENNIFLIETKVY